MAHITLADLTGEETTVELFDGHTYKVLTITRSVQKKLEKVGPLLEGLEDEEDADKVIDTLAGAIDALLTPAGDAPAAKKALVDAWKADNLNLAQIRGLFERVQEAAVARPT